jgi:hypothetical protein
MADVSRSEPQITVGETWRRLNFEQRAAAVASVLLIVSTFGPFSFVEVAIILIGGGVLYLLRKRAEGGQFHVPFGDGAVIAAAGAWTGLLIVVRLFDRPLGQGLLALVCAALLMLAGLRERAVRPPDDLPPEAAPPPTGRPAQPPDQPAPPPEPTEREPDTAETQAMPAKVLPEQQPLRPPPGDQPPLWDDPPSPGSS